MTNFKIFDGNENQYDYRQPNEAHGWYAVGTSLKFLEFAGRLVRPLPVLIT